jgi:hypothetical protein
MLKQTVVGSWKYDKYKNSKVLAGTLGDIASLGDGRSTPPSHRMAPSLQAWPPPQGLGSNRHSNRTNLSETPKKSTPAFGSGRNMPFRTKASILPEWATSPAQTSEKRSTDSARES